MTEYIFNENELNVRERIPDRRHPERPGRILLSFPCSEKENINAMYAGRAVWMPYGVETAAFCPDIIPDNIARGMVLSAETGKYTNETFGGRDMFGVEWVYEPEANGSMEKPGAAPLITDASEWKEKIVFPDIDSWDWDASARANEKWLANGKANSFWFLNGMGFERLISFMGFQGAAMAIIDEEQEDDLHELLDALTDLHIRLVDRVCEAYGKGVDGFTLHDDWGSQRQPMFSMECAEKFFVPRMKRFTDHIKSKGRFADLHSCGKLEDRITCFVNAGWQSWAPMAINDTERLQREYGDKIIISCVPSYDPAKTAQQNAAEFIENCYRPDRPCMLSRYAGNILTEEYIKEVYCLSRQCE